MNVLLQGAYTLEVLIRRNVKLVMSIAKNWMRNSFSTANANLSGGGGSDGSGGTGKNDKGTKHFLTRMYEGSCDRPPFDEAVQEGMMGLAHAVDKYDLERGLCFSTFPPIGPRVMFGYAFNGLLPVVCTFLLNCTTLT
mmetsp:Transcript_13576/g.22124  ORF Transcript_13576/g.22124 Transcript_13576/m.22124 type:complete len:138 (-) Transcript_13576:234-647(-)